MEALEHGVRAVSFEKSRDAERLNGEEQPSHWEPWACHWGFAGSRGREAASVMFSWFMTIAINVRYPAEGGKLESTDGRESLREQWGCVSACDAPQLPPGPLCTASSGRTVANGRWKRKRAEGENNGVDFEDFFFSSNIFYWSIVDLQCCVNFCK